MHCTGWAQPYSYSYVNNVTEPRITALVSLVQRGASLLLYNERWACKHTDGRRLCVDVKTWTCRFGSVAVTWYRLTSMSAVWTSYYNPSDSSTRTWHQHLGQLSLGHFSLSRALRNKSVLCNCLSVCLSVCLSACLLIFLVYCVLWALLSEIKDSILF